MKSHHIVFVKEDKISSKQAQKDNSYTIDLSNPSYGIDFFKIIPKKFVISTNNGRYYFNLEMLKDTSRVISKFYDSNPDQFEYHLNLDDEDHVFKKIEQIYQGQIVKFDQDDQPVLHKITQLLKLEKFPKNYKNQGILLPVEVMYYSTVLISKKSFRGFVANTFFQTFTINTKNHQYQCNLVGIRLSKVISNFLIQNPAADNFIYDFEDDFSEFQNICDIFNFKKTVITVNNIESLKKIAEELQITVILNEINQNLCEIEKIAQRINDQQEEVNKIEELFDYLYHINKLTVSKVKQFIIESEWSSSIEKVEELTAFILQVIKTDIQVHSKIADLIIELQNSAQENNKLSILIPTIAQQLMESFGESAFICSFINKLYKRGIIPLKDIEYEINELYSKHKNNSIEEFTNTINWFLPEISQMSNIKSILESQIKEFKDYKSSFFKYYYPENIDKYKEMIESEEPDDKITKFLLHDDVESFQNAIVSEQIDISESFVPYNIYDIFIGDNHHISYIDYAAAHGSIKCFKYLLLNHATLSTKTFKLALHSGNEEIIRIVDQRIKNIESDIIKQIIEKHQYGLFNWFLDEKIGSDCETQYFFSNISSISSQNGNAHSLIDIISQAYNFVDAQSIILRCAENGFLTLFHIIVNIFGISKIDFTKIRRFSDFPRFFTFLTKYMNQYDFEHLFECAAEHNCKMTINCIYDNFLFKKFDMKEETCLHEILNIFIKKHSNDLFFSLVSKMQQYKPKVFKQFSSKKIPSKINSITEFICSFIYTAIEYKNKEIIEYILMHKTDIDELVIKAVYTKDIEIVKLILKYKSKPCHINENSLNGTPLCIAVQKSDIHMVEFLLTLDCINPNIGALGDGYTPLMSALQIGQNNIINALFNDPKVDINGKNGGNNDMFQFARHYKRFEVYKLFADRGNAEAMFYYAYMLSKGKNFPINKEEAAKYYKMSADKGYTDSMVNYANMLRTGDGVPANTEEAIKYYKMAIDKGNSAAMFNYAFMLQDGNGVPVNNEEAIKYFKMSADKGDSDAMFEYALSIYKDDAYQEEAMRYFKMSADRGDKRAMNNYGFLLLKKSNSEKYEEACHYFRKAIARNNPHSMINYGFMLDNGLGTPVDHEEANRLYNNVISLGEVDLIFEFAELLEKGFEGVQISKIESCRYYKIAADAGCIEAIYKYANMVENGIFIESNKEEAINYYKIASEKGHVEAEKDYKRLIGESKD